MKRVWKLTIRSKIIGPTIAIVVAVLVTIIIYTSIGVSSLANRLTEDKATAISKAAELRLKELTDYTKLATANIVLQEGLANVMQRGTEDELFAYMELKRKELGVYNLVVTDSRGIVMMRTNAPRRGDSIANFPNVASALSGKPISTYTVGGLIPVALATTVPVYSGNKLIGVLIANFNMSSEEFVDEFAEVFGAEVAVFIGNTPIAITVRNEHNERDFNFPVDQKIVEAVTKGGETYKTISIINGKPFSEFYIPLIDEVGISEAMFFFGISTEFNAEETRNLRRNIAIIGIAGLLLLSLSIFFYIRRLMKPLIAIIQNITDDKTDLTSKIPIAQNDEIGELAKSFNTYRSRLDGMLNEHQKMLIQIQTIREQTEAELNAQLAQERDIIRTMKDNIEQGVFLMDREFKILPEYSQPLISILSYYESELAGKNFLDILAASLDGKQLQTMKGYFSMIFEKTKRAAVLEAANPIAEFEYKIDDRTKTLSTRFNLIEKPHADPVIIGILQDITKEKEFEKELEAQSKAKDLEMKNMFDVIQIDPLVFQDFIEDTESNFNYINSILKDKTLTQKQIVTKIFQNVHAIKSNSLILGLEVFGQKLHDLEDEIKEVSNKASIEVNDILDLAFKLENIMQEKDSYVNIVKKLEAYKSSNQMESVLVNSLKKAAERTAMDNNKKVELVVGDIDYKILESNLRKPIKDILFQCARNSVYHSIENEDERLKSRKKPVGQLTLSVKEIGDKAVITFSDDGKGLDWAKIKKRYLEMHPDAKDTSHKVLLGVIFLPGFSTSSKTTTTAGRGVGLSLVKDLVKENGGSISVNSTDQGLTMKFTFPMPIAAAPAS